jgi:predicted nucleotidyltransferase
MLMPSLDYFLSPNQQAVIDRFTAVCRAEARVVAAFLGGSHVTGTADVYSDLDLYLVAVDEAYDGLLAEREAFVALLGEPLFMEDFGIASCTFFILSDGTEGELWIGSESRFKTIHGGPIRVLVDRQDILTGASFPMHEADPVEQLEVLREQIVLFWHEFSHFVKAMGRKQLWFAYGSLEVMRGMCVNLARLRHNFGDGYVGEEPYFKVETIMPVEELAPLQETFCPLEPVAMHRAASSIVRFYQEIAPPLAQKHGIAYPERLVNLMVPQLAAIIPGDL